MTANSVAQKYKMFGKKIAALFIFSLLVFSAHADKYKIVGASYNITGKTKPNLLERRVPVNTERIFASEKELMEYVRDWQLRLLNTRLFSAVIVDFIVAATTDGAESRADEKPQAQIVAATSEHSEYVAENTDDFGGIHLVTLVANLTDSSHFIIAPYPKYSSGKGLDVKIRAVDSNFLGTASEMRAGVMGGFEQKSSSGDDKIKPKFGFEFNYDYPFNLSIFEATWTNDVEFEYTIGNSMPEWNAKTGLILSKKLTPKVKVEFGFIQSSVGELDYKEFNDQIYFTENAYVAFPIKVFEKDKWNDIIYTPSFNFVANWDANGISKKNEDLLGPDLSIGHSLKTGRVDWTEHNFRNGLQFIISQSIGFDTIGVKPFHTFSAEMKAYKGFTYAGLTADVFFYYDWNNGSQKFGTRLRGIRDDEFFASGFAHKKAAKSRAALIINLDSPIYLFKTDFSKYRKNMSNSAKKFTRLFDMEFQLSPFIDMGLFYNEATGKAFSFKDGYYTAGAELLVYFTHWKSLVFRLSVGVDLGQTLFKKWINTDWRADVSPYELSFGIGLHY